MTYSKIHKDEVDTRWRGFVNRVLPHKGKEVLLFQSKTQVADLRQRGDANTLQGILEKRISIETK